MTYATPSACSALMTYEPLRLQRAHNLSGLGLSAQVIHRARNVATHAETQAIEARSSWHMGSNDGVRA